MSMWCFKQLKDFILRISVSRSFFSQKAFLNKYAVIRVSFPSGWCVDEAVGNWSNYRGYKYDAYFLQYHEFTAIHFMNHEGLCQIIRTTFNIYICLNHCWWCEHNQSLKLWEKAKGSKTVIHLGNPFYK